jgi:probable HAF family extracellular repeat protein
VAINDSGQVTGSSDLKGSVNIKSHAFIWKNDGSPMQDLGDLFGYGSFGVAINSSGQLMGGAYTDHYDDYSVAFLWKNDGTKILDLGTLGGKGSSGVAINASGQVTGSSYLAGDRKYHAFIWKNDGTKMQDLGTLGGSNSDATGINASGQVTGRATAKDSTYRAFVWRNDGTKMQDLNALIDPTDPLKPYVTLFEGDAINDAGQILADGTDSRTGQQHAYLLHGTVLTLLPRSLAFGNQKAGTSSASKSITMTNTSASAVPITGIALAGTGAGQFAFTDNCGKSLAGKAACTIKMMFKPTTTGAKSASLRVNGGGGGLRWVSLTGDGV